MSNPPPPPAEAAPRLYTTTTFDPPPGYQVQSSFGVVYGLVVRSMGFAKSFTGGFSSLRQGEVSQYTEVLEDARRHALDRLLENAGHVGANGVLGVRFDSTEIGNNMSEIVAYGTGVVLVPAAG